MFGLGAAHGDDRGRGVVVVWGRGFDFRLPPEIRAMAERADGDASSGGFMNACSISATKRHLPTTASSAIAARWFWSGAIRPPARCCPGLRKAQETRDFGIAQLTSSSCIPALERRHRGHAELPRDQRQGACRWSGRSSPTSCCCTGPGRNISINVAETVAALKQETNARVVVLGAGAGVEARAAVRGAALLSCCITR